MLWDKKVNEKLARKLFGGKVNKSAMSKDELLGIDTFFVFRAAAYIAVGMLVVLLSVVWDAAYSKQLLPIAIVILCLTAFYSGRILYVGKQRKYFVLELTCVGIHFPKNTETVGAFLNPMSQTAFRKIQQVSFIDKNENRIDFSFERGRRFLEGGKYAFYFHDLQPGEEVTIEALERLKIDHRVLVRPIKL